jgi:transglutaminase-like putative cysteine protease
MTPGSDKLVDRHISWLLGSLALVTAPHIERLPWWITLLVVTLFAWRAYLALYDLRLPHKWLLMLIAIGALGGIYITYGRILGRDSGVALLIVMLALKLMEMATLRDAMILIFIAYFLVITNFLYSQSIPTTVFMLIAMWAITSTMVGFQFRQRQPGYRYQLRFAGIMLLQSTPLMLVLFVLFPRMQGPLWGMPQDALASATGLSEEMSPGSVSSLLLSDAVAFRVTFESAIPPATQQLYWRGPVMWDFDGYTWTAPRVPYPTPRPFDALDNEVAYSVTVEPHGKRWLFALDLPLRTPARASMTSDFQILFQSPLTNRLRYDMLSTLRYRDRSELPRYEMQRALRLPGDGNPRARAMAADMRKRTVDDRAYINMVLAMFRNDNFSYTTTPPLLRADPVDEFLLSTRAGYCEHYASAFTFLMRAGGVPARVVTGYQGGEFNTFSNYMIVRQADAHAWSEVWLKDSGWTRVDPTAAVSPARVQTGVAAAVPQNEQLPLMLRGEYRWLHGARLTWDLLANSWNQLVLGYTMDNQRQLMQRIGISDATWQTLVIVMMLTTGVVTLALALLLLLSFRRSRPDPVIAAYARFCRRLANRGVTRHPSEGPDAFCKRAAAIRPEIAAAIGSISRLYVHLRYGREAGSDEINELKRAVAVFRA